jgi:hypothetical protein
MRKNILIIVLLIAALTGAFTLKANAQLRCNTANVPVLTKDSTLLLGDETTITYVKTVAKIECCNESIAKVILQKWEQLITRYNCTRKKDRHVAYKQYNIYLNKEDAQYIIKWAKTNL